MPLPAVLFLAVLALLALVVAAPFALLYFVVCRLLDTIDNGLENLPWSKPGRKRRVKQGLGLATLRNVFQTLNNGSQNPNRRGPGSSTRARLDTDRG